MNAWLYLMLAILSEVVATSALKACEEFSRFWPSLLVVVGYAMAFWLMTLSLRSIPVAIAYAIWSAAGIALLTVIGWWWYGERLNLSGMTGLAMIIGGVLLVRLSSTPSS